MALSAGRAPWLLGGALSEGGNLISWLDSTLQLPPLKEAEPLVANLPPDGHGLTILPFVSGERSPGWHAEARAAIVGIGTHTSPVDIFCAGIEALAYQLGAVFEQLNTALQARLLRAAGRPARGPRRGGIAPITGDWRMAHRPRRTAVHHVARIVHVRDIAALARVQQGHRLGGERRMRGGPYDRSLPSRCFSDCR